MDKELQQRMQLNSDKVLATGKMSVVATQQQRSNKSIASSASKINMTEYNAAKETQITRSAAARESQTIRSATIVTEPSVLEMKRAREEQPARYTVPVNAVQTNKPVAVPSGWNRILEKGAITYISPNKSRLRSMEDIKFYLIDSETCKCGLKCPLKAEETFSFNPLVPSVAPVKQDPAKLGCGSCKISSSFEKLLPHFSPEEISKLLKKSKKKKKKSSTSSHEELQRKMKYQKIDQEMLQQSYAGQLGIRTDIQGKKMIPDSDSTKIIPGFNQLTAYHQINPHAAGRERINQDIQLSDHADYSSSYKPESQRAKIISQGQLESTRQVSIIRPSATAAGKPSQANKKSKRSQKEKQLNEAANLSGKHKQNLKSLAQSNKTNNATNHSKSTNTSLKNQQTGTMNQFRPYAEVSSSIATQSKAFAAAREGQLPSSPRASSLNLMTSQAPPNITLPPSHSNKLPTALTQSIRSSAQEASKNSSEDLYLGLSPGSSNSGTSPIELEPRKTAPEPDPFSHLKVKANVYWGSKSPSGPAENVPISSDINNIGSEVAKSVGTQIAISSSTNSNIEQQQGSHTARGMSSPSVKLRGVAETGQGKAASKPSSKPQQQLYMSKVNGIACESSTQSSTGISTESLTKDYSAIPSSIQHMSASLSQSLTNPTVSSTVNPLAALESTNIGSVVSPARQRNPAAGQSPGTKHSPEKDTKQVTHTDNTQTAQRQTPSSGQPVSLPSTAQGAQMVLFQFVSQSGSARPTVQTSVAVSQISGGPMRGQTVPGFQNVYGISNAPNMLRGTNAPYQSGIAASGIAAGNPAQFLIMGSQASQALQHLALQNNALESTMHRAENPHAMYVQNIPGYASALKSGQQNIGFTYANVPLQFMTIGDTQVIGKQPQAQHPSLDGYQPVYQYYQGNRPADAGKFDTSKPNASQATTFVYPGIHQYPPGIPNNYVRIAPANTIGRPALPVPRFPLVPDVLKSDSQCNGPSLSQNTASSASPSQTTCSTSKSSEKVPSVELNKITKVTKTLKQDLLGNSETLQSQVQSEVDKNAGKTNQMAETDTGKSDAKEISSEVNAKSNTELNFEPSDSDNRIQQIPVENKPPVKQDANTGQEVSTGNMNTDSEKAPSQLPPSQNKAKSSETASNGNEGQLQNTDPTRTDLDDQEEISLQCHEDCNTASEESRTPTPETANQTGPEQTLDFRNIKVSANCALKNSNHLRIGDLIWGHQKGYSAWPGKVVSETQVGESPADNGKVWVKWFGEHTHSQIELDQLKILSEGLKDLESSSRRRKNRSSRKISESLEKAILEALQEINESNQDYHVYKDFLDNIIGDLSTQPSKKLKR